MMEIDTRQHVTKSGAQTEGAEHSLDFWFFYSVGLVKLGGGSS